MTETIMTGTDTGSGIHRHLWLVAASFGEVESSRLVSLYLSDLSSHIPQHFQTSLSSLEVGWK